MNEIPADYAVICLWGPKSTITRWCQHFPETTGEAEYEREVVRVGNHSRDSNARALTLVFEHSDTLEEWIAAQGPGSSEPTWLMRSLTPFPLPRPLQMPKPGTLEDLPGRAGLANTDGRSQSGAVVEL
jgi:hypothetical protein